MEGLLSILGKIGFDWHVALANLVSFFIIFLILKKYAFGPVGKLIEERKETINTGLLNAEKNEKLLANTKIEYEAIILNARTEANDLIQNAKKEAMNKKTELLEDAKKEVTTMIESGKKTLEIEKVKIVEDAKKEIVSLVLQTTEKLIGTKVDSEYESRVVKELKNI